MSTIRELAERTGLDRNQVSDLLNGLREKGWVKVARGMKTGAPRWELTEEGRMVLPPITPDGYKSIGSHEAQELALAAREYYLSKGWFFALARQEPGMKRRVDCIAYDYDSGLVAGVEIEGSEHVLHDHAEQVKRHMFEVAPFNELHFWAHEGAAERIAELRLQLRGEDQSKVKVFAVGEEPNPSTTQD
jgi:transcriptional regulator with XRE-family HTH domain